MCGQSFKNVFQNFEKSPWEHYTLKKTLLIFKIYSYTFKVTTTKIS